MAKDPVCGMEVDEATAKYKTEYMGKTYYFCAKGCLEAFRRELKNTSPKSMAVAIKELSPSPYISPFSEVTIIEQEDYCDKD